MRRRLVVLVAPFLLLLSSKAYGQSTCAPGATCVPAEDKQVFVKLLQEKKCLQTTQPTVQFDPITLVEDKEGRIFVSGADPLPYKVKLSWCDYDLESSGKLRVVAAKSEEPTWGFRFRLKATPSYLPVSAFLAKDGYAGLDFGLLVEPFFLYSANLNAYLGVRSLGAGLGFDLSRNMGLYAGYAVTWTTWEHNPHLGMSFALW